MVHLADVSVRRGRVVILGEDVRSDPRIVSQARDMAALGWEVFVIGPRIAADDADEWQFDGATVRVFDRPTPLRARRFEYRRAVFRAPLAYRPGRQGPLKKQLATARMTDLRFRRAVLAIDRPMLADFRRVLLGAVLLIARNHVRWVDLRIAAGRRLQRHRQKMDGLSDRASAWWWRRTMGDGAWRKLEPGLWDSELALGSHIDELEPDLIHAHGVTTLPLGVRAAMRASGRGRSIAVIWDQVESQMEAKNPRSRLARTALQREFAPYADTILTHAAQTAEQLDQIYSVVAAPQRSGEHA